MNIKNHERRSLPDAFRLLVESGSKPAGAAKKPPAEKDGFDWEGTEIVAPERKQAISLRLDAEVLEYFKLAGKGYQTRINSVLRAYVKARQG